MYEDSLQARKDTFGRLGLFEYSLTFYRFRKCEIRT